MSGSAAPIGNQYWRMRSKHGRNPTFETAEQLWDACVEYFEWAHANPLAEDYVFAYEGVADHEPIKKMRAMTLTGLYIFLDIGKATWKSWRDDRKDLKDTIERVEAIIYTQKFEGAAAGLLNQSIIARDLGLVEKTQAELSGPNGGPIPTAQIDVTKLSAAQLAALASIRIPTDGG